MVEEDGQALAARHVPQPQRVLACTQVEEVPLHPQMPKQRRAQARAEAPASQAATFVSPHTLTTRGQLGVVGAPAQEGDGPRVAPQHVLSAHGAASPQGGRAAAGRAMLLPTAAAAAALYIPHNGGLVLAAGGQHAAVVGELQVPHLVRVVQQHLRVFVKVRL